MVLVSRAKLGKQSLVFSSYYYYLVAITIIFVAEQHSTQCLFLFFSLGTAVLILPIVASIVGSILVLDWVGFQSYTTGIYDDVV